MPLVGQILTGQIENQTASYAFGGADPRQLYNNNISLNSKIKPRESTS